MRKGTWIVVVCLTFLVSSWLFTNCQPATSTADQPDSTALSKPVAASYPAVVCQLARTTTFSLTSAATGLIRTPAQSKLSFRIGGTIMDYSNLR